MKALLLSVLMLGVQTREVLAASEAKAAPLAGAAEAYAEMRSTFGMVPTFLKEFPQESIPGAWQEFRDVQLSPNTALNGKTKELIGLAVASQIPCQYCIYFHKKSAKFNGATTREMHFATAIAASTRKWSTYFYGAQIPMDTFKSDINKIVTAAKNRGTSGGAATVAQMPMDATAATQDMEKTLGSSPEFIKSYSNRGMAGAWNEYKSLEMNDAGPLPAKVRFLVSLAVSSQIPCQYCVYSDVEFAKLHGAKPDEIQEAIAMAGLVRHWSTYLNGLQLPQKAFEREVDKIFKNLELKRDRMNKRISSR